MLIQQPETLGKYWPIKRAFTADCLKEVEFWLDKYPLAKRKCEVLGYGWMWSCHTKTQTLTSMSRDNSTSRRLNKLIFDPYPHTYYNMCLSTDPELWPESTHLAWNKATAYQNTISRDTVIDMNWGRWRSCVHTRQAQPTQLFVSFCENVTPSQTSRKTLLLGKLCVCVSIKAVSPVVDLALWWVSRRSCSRWDWLARGVGGSERRGEARGPSRLRISWRVCSANKVWIRARSRLDTAWPFRTRISSPGHSPVGWGHNTRR